MRIVSSEELQKAIQEKKVEEVAIPEVKAPDGESLGVIVGAYTFGDLIAVNEAGYSMDGEGKVTYNHHNERLMALCRAVVKPAIDIRDCAWIENLPAATADRIIDTAYRLGGRTQSAFDELKEMMRRNTVFRRLYSVCVMRLGRLPSELTDISEREFNTMLAALEVEAEELANDQPEDE